MTQPAPLTDQQLAEIQARHVYFLARRSGRSCPAHPSADDVPALLAEVARLRAELATESRLHGETCDDRDRFHDMADKLADAIAPEEIIGEHSSGNCPWENALDYASTQEKARQDELDQLRTELADAARMRDFHARSAGHVARRRDRAEQLISHWRDGDIDAEAAIERIARALSAEGDDAPAVPSA